MDLSKYFTGEVVEVQRSAVHFASYNPRVIDEEEKRQLKRSIKKLGVVGGLVLNKRTMTIVSGHQKIKILDELQKYDPKTHANDYKLRFEVIDVDLKTEKEANILFNNPNAQGTWDRDKLADMVAKKEIDYKEAGLTEADLSLMGMDLDFKTEEEGKLADSLAELTKEADEENAAEREQRQMQRQAERAAKVQHMKEVKAEVKAASEKAAGKMDAYVMLSFDSMENKNAFMQRFGYSVDDKFIKGEDFDQRCEVAEMEE